jgi:acyl-CoA synthetase (AMP-forming)/AMP-acid ligase II
MMLNIGDFLARRALLEPNKVGLISLDKRYTFNELNRRANRLARALSANGIGQGDRVAILLRNGVEYYDFCFGVARLGAILTAVNWRLTHLEVNFILDDCGAKLFFYDEEFGEAASGQNNNLPELEETIVVGSSGTNDVRTYEDFFSGINDSPFIAVGGDDDPLMLMYTSGTSGRPKGALLSHNHLFWCSSTVTHTLDHRQSDVNFLPLPLYHIGGICYVTIFVHLGSTAILIPAWDTHQALSLIAQEKINHFMAVPTMLDGILNYPDLDQYDLSSLRWLLACAAPVPPDLIRSFFDRGILVLQSYGLTETAGPATVTPKDMAIEKIGTAGLPFFHTEVRVVGTNDEDVRPGDVGEVWIRGPHVISSYWRNETATRNAMVNDWFRSGDLATKDEDGYLTIVDRKQDMIISGGENIYPAELERFLYSHPKLEQIAVIGMADEKWGETVCAVIVLHEGESLTLDELQSYCDGQISRYKIPRRLIIRKEALPRNPTGKLLKGELRCQIQE